MSWRKSPTSRAVFQPVTRKTRLERIMGRNFSARLQRMAAWPSYGSTDSTAPGLGDGGEMGQPIGERGDGAHGGR